MSKNNFGQISGMDFGRVRLLLVTASLFSLLLTCPGQIIGAEASSVFRSDFKTALQEAEEKKLPLLVHFYADWCMPCKRMEREVFSNTAVKDFLGGHFVAVKVNSDHRQDLIARYGVQTLPSDVVVDSLTGRVIAMNSGYQDRTGYLATISQAEARFIKAHAYDFVAEKPNVTTEAIPSSASNKKDEPELGEPKPVIGLDGFSPVALGKTRQWNRGSPKFAWDHKDVTYYFSTREELVEFRNNPELYAPKLLGCDPVILYESDKAVAGNIRYGAYFDNELFLFKTEERRIQFKANPEKYIRLQHALKVDEIEHTVIR